MLEKVSRKGNQTLLHCWECKSIEPLWRTVWRFFIKLKIELSYDPQSYSWMNIQRKHGSTEYMHPTVQSYLPLCNLRDCSMPGFPVLHHIPELAQTYVHWVSDTIQPSHPNIPFSSCLLSFPASGSFPTRMQMALTWSF